MDIEKYTVMRLKKDLPDDKCYVPSGLFTKDPSAPENPKTNLYTWVKRQSVYGANKDLWSAPGFSIVSVDPIFIRFSSETDALDLNLYFYEQTDWRETEQLGIASYFEIDPVHLSKKENAKKQIKIGDLIMPNDHVRFLKTTELTKPSSAIFDWLLVTEKCDIGAWCFATLSDQETSIFVPWSYLCEFSI